VLRSEPLGNRGLQTLLRASSQQLRTGGEAASCEGGGEGGLQTDYRCRLRLPLLTKAIKGPPVFFSGGWDQMPNKIRPNRLVEEKEIIKAMIEELRTNMAIDLEPKPVIDRWPAATARPATAARSTYLFFFTISVNTRIPYVPEQLTVLLELPVLISKRKAICNSGWFRLKNACTTASITELFGNKIYFVDRSIMIYIVLASKRDVT
jgi:hypothetical protein